MYGESFYGCHTVQHQLQWKQKKLSSFKSNKNIHKKEDWSYYVVSANKGIFKTDEHQGDA